MDRSRLHALGALGATALVAGTGGIAARSVVQRMQAALGHIQNLGAATGHIRGGRLKALGVTSEQRHPQLPEVPTMAEQGVPGFVVTSWQAFMAPRGLPPAVRSRLQAELVAALKAPEVKERFATQGFDVVANTPEQFSAFQRDEIARWSKVVKQKGVTPD